jgi:hypothetical protein
VAALPSPPRKTRKTSHQEQIARQNERKHRVVHAQAHARATILVAEERAKEKENRRTTTEVIAQVEGEFRARGYGVILSKPTINRYVRLNMIGTFPLARGYEGAMPHAAFELFVLAAESFIQIKGVNKDHIERNTLMILFNELCGVTSSKGRRVKDNMFERVMRATNVSLNASVSPVVEDRRVRWTTYSNLHAWFVSFKAFLVEFGFATIGSDGRLEMSEEMLRWILNVDETEVSLDGSKTIAGGRPAVSFHDPHFPLTQRPAAKSSLSCTGIFGSNAAGECMPIHWQLPTAATAEEREKLRFNFLRHVRSTRGRFGYGEERVWPCTIGLNEKGGMNDEEFDKYIDNSIVPLYPDLEDTPGKRVLLKVDSGPGRNGRDLLNKARFRGVYLFPGLPNATSVQQETDMNYGPFKSVVRSNLKKISTACFSAQKRTTPPHGRMPTRRGSWR